MGKRLLDPDQKRGCTLGLLRCSAPRAHDRSKKRTRGRHWLFLDADKQNGPPVHEKVQHFPREHLPYPETQNGWTLRTSQRLTQCGKRCSIVVISVGGVSNSKMEKCTETNGVACTQHASLAGDGNKISSSHTVNPRETKLKTSSMSVGKPQHRYDQNGKHSSDNSKTPERLEFLTCSICAQLISLFSALLSCLSSHVCILGKAMF